MKKTIVSIVSVALGLLFSTTLVYSLQKEEPVIVQTEELSKEFLNKQIPIIDIRTKEDWKTTAVLKDSILMTFFKHDGRFDKRFFIRNLNAIVDKNSQFAILSRTGDKSEKVARILKSEGYENVINLKGGIRQGIKNKVEFVTYHN